MNHRGKSWPWRKKSSDRVNLAATSETLAAVQTDPSKLYEDREVSSTFSIVESKPDNPMVQWRQAEEKLKEANEKLMLAISDNAVKDNAVMQHSKVTEEAVLGWEKVKTEVIDLKAQLDSTLQGKAAAEDQLTRVHGALKECMLEIRHVREAQEKKIIEAVSQNTRQWEKVRVEFEAKLAELNQRVFEFEAENKVLSKNVEERGTKIVELTDGKSQAEAKVSVLHLQLGMMEKENSSLTYELNILSKELEIRNKEQELKNREAEVSNRQVQDSAKKVAKLEADCHKLRTLLRRKLPGPAAIAQMKLEVESLGYESGSLRSCKTGGKSISSSSGFSVESVTHRGKNGNKDMAMLFQRMHGMEEETKMLREILAQKNDELQASRLLCARMATKLSSVESHLEAMSSCSTISRIRNMGLNPPDLTGRLGGNNRSLSVVSISESSINHDDQASCADNWTLTLASELACVKNDEVEMKIILDPSAMKLMDDFTEMEHLALKMESEPVGAYSIDAELAEKKTLLEEIFEGKQSPNEKPLATESKVQITEETCGELRNKLLGEEHLSYLEKQNHADEVTVVGLQEKTDLAFETQAQNSTIDAVVKQTEASVGNMYQSTLIYGEISSVNFTQRQLPQGVTCQDRQGAVPLLTGNVPNVYAFVEQPTSESLHSKEPIHKALHLIEALALAVGLESRDKVVCHLHKAEEVTHTEETKVESTEHNPKCEERTDAEVFVKTGSASGGLFWENIDLGQCMRRMLTVSDSLLQWNSFVEFMQELSTVLEATLACALESQKGTCDMSNQSLEGQKVSVGFGMSGAHKNDEQQLDIKDIKALHLTESREIPVSNSSADQNFDAPTAVCAVEFDMVKDYCKFAQVQEEILQIKSEKENLEQRLETANECVENLKSDLHNANRLVIELKENLLLSQESEQPTNIEGLLSQKLNRTNQESEVKSDMQAARIQEKVSEMQLKLQKEQKLHADALSRMKILEEQFKRVMSNAESPVNISSKAVNSELAQASLNESGKLRKEREIVAATKKLDECHKTILVLGTQLKALVSPHESPDRSSCQKAKPPCGKQNCDLHYRYSAELNTGLEVDHARGYPGQQLNQRQGWPKFDRDQELESQWSSPRYMNYSPHAVRAQAGVDLKTRAHRRQSDIGYFSSNDFKYSDMSGCFHEAHVAASPSDELQHTPVYPSVGYGVVRKTDTSIRDLSKAFQAAHTKSPTAKPGNSRLGRFFSRSKNHTK